MMQVTGKISTLHADAPAVASSLAPDNLTGMTTIACGDRVVTELSGTHVRSVIASVDDYLMNLAIADEATTLTRTRTGSRTEEYYS
jgi:hypothetical protein